MMLEIRPNCENCGKLLPNESTEAMICSFECTFCEACIETALHNVCPNCGGGFEKRPVRPRHKLIGHPAKQELYRKPVQLDEFLLLLQTFENVPPAKR